VNLEEEKYLELRDLLCRALLCVGAVPQILVERVGVGDHLSLPLKPHVHAAALNLLDGRNGL
jgi:hypothetical protein